MDPKVCKEEVGYASKLGGFLALFLSYLFLKHNFFEAGFDEIIRSGVFNESWVLTAFASAGPSEQPRPPRPWPRHFLAYQYFYLQKIH